MVTYSAVIYDLFGTLVDDFASSLGRMPSELAQTLGVPDEQFIPLWNQTAGMRTLGVFQTVEASIEYVCNTMNAHPGAEQIREAVEIRIKYIRQALQPRPKAVDTLSELKNQGYRIGLISNCSIEIPILWQETPFAHVIDEPIFSSRERVKKPDARIYHLACERLGMMPDSCLYIADGEDHELAGASKAGLHPVLIRISARQASGRLHEEAREWQGVTITSFAEVLELVK